MLNSVEKHPSSSSESTLGRWVHQAIESEGRQVKFHVRGNNLHILYRGNQVPDRLATLHRLVSALRQTDLNTLLPSDHALLYQIQIYGCEGDSSQPNWTASIYLNQIELHWEQIQQELKAAKRTTATSGKFALALSNRSLARQGQETAIASYLSETLSNLGVAVRVSVKAIPFKTSSSVYSTDITVNEPATKRLCIACEASYSPDPSVIGEPITQKLRDLEIEGYRDAVILFQVAGEARLDWMLRVDLTPPEEMLREWARWGDVEAIQRLLNQTIAHRGIQVVTASLKEQTLHLFCEVMAAVQAQQTSKEDTAPAIPDQSAVKLEVAPLLEALAPQGIHAAALYGQVANQDAPAWIEWLELPAALHPALSDTAIELAQQGDWGAIAFLLHRLINPHLDTYLSTGGIRLQLLPKQDVLHIMSEAVICPEQRQVGYQIVRFLKPLKLSQVAGVRIYGRRAGQKHPMWSYGVDFAPRDRIVPEATPEFAATDSYIHELISPTGEAVLRPDLTPADLQSAWTVFRQRLVHRLQSFLIRSQLFTAPDNETTALAVPHQVSQQSIRVAVLWGAIGVLLTLQTNWLLLHALRLQAKSNHPPNPAPEASSPPPAAVVSSTAPVATPDESELTFPEVTLSGSPDAETEAFTTDGFTAPNASPAVEPSSPEPPALEIPASNLPYTPQNAVANLTLAENLATDPPLPNFNSRQLADKLKLYYRILEESGPPDVLVVGSSRALRGVDPTALEQALAELGYADVEVFNFGVNGATAQVVDLLLRQILTPDQLPRLIVWADGARAFNSNATDVTYNGIAASLAFQQLQQGTLVLPKVAPSTAAAPSPPASRGINISLTDSYQSLDRWLSQQLDQMANTQGQRDRLKTLVQDGLTSLLPRPPVPPAILPEGTTQTAANLPRDYELVDLKGFLSLGIQFNPATYYQKYARVAGDYDRDYRDFQIPGVQETALQSLLQHMQAHQKEVVFVNLPMTDEYLDSARLGYEQQFRDYMVSLSLRQPGFQFRDLGERWTTEYDYFSDPSHLNRYGAYAVSQQIAQDPLISWTKP